MSWLYYVIEANAYLSVLYLIYFIAFSRETYYTLNRFYLLTSCAVAFTIPLLQLGKLKTMSDKPLMIAANKPVAALYHQSRAIVATRSIGIQELIFYSYLAGVIIFLLLLLFKLYRISQLTRAKNAAINNQYKLIYLPDSKTAFSFFNYLFVGKEANGLETIIRHELVHIRQKHTFDILLLEIFKTVSWFNPFIYLLQNSLKILHEYIADEITAAQEADALLYSSFLIDNAYGLAGSSMTHSFFNYNLLKKRIIMLNQQRSGKLARLKYLAVIPVCAGLLCVSTLCFSKDYGLIDLLPQQIDTTHVVPPPPPASPRKFPPSPPVPPAAYTKKGFKYTEDAYLISNKANFRVIITEKNGEQKAFFRNSSTPAEKKILIEKYGYTFPDMPIYTKLPPPPPMTPAPKAITKRPPPPPPALPVEAQTQVLPTKAPKSATFGKPDPNLTFFRSQAVAYKPEIEQPGPQPLIIVNGVKYDLKNKVKPGQKVYCQAPDSVRKFSPGDEIAMKKWGIEAINGVIELYGKNASVTIK